MTRKSPSTKKQRLNPDELANYEDERDSLLRSLEDLDREHDAGDLDDDDYQTLHSSYTARTAAVIRAITQHKSQTELASTPPPSAKRRLIIFAGLSIFSIVVGLVLAQGLGERGVNDELSGSFDTSRRDQVLRCQQQGEEGDLVGGLACFSDVLEEDPTNVDALTYRGWFQVQQVDRITQSGESEVAQQFLATGKADLDAAIEEDPSGPEAYAFRAIAFDRLEKPAEACADLAALTERNPPPFLFARTQGIAARNRC